MVENPSSESTSGPKVPPILPNTSDSTDMPSGDGGRCHWCGYPLKGLASHGACPECGTKYTPKTASHLTPSPGALVICLRLGWPFLGMLVMGIPVGVFGVPDFGISLGIYAMIVAIPLNSYFQVRAMLKKHLPEQKRTKGFIAGLRSLGTVIAILAFILTLAPLILLGACLVIMAGSEF